jgi:lipid-A-disaccharide synthase-like uncharacterized protein
MGETKYYTEVVEAITVIYAVNLYRKLGFFYIILEGDALQIVCEIKFIYIYIYNLFIDSPMNL